MKAFSEITPQLFFEWVTTHLADSRPVGGYGQVKDRARLDQEDVRMARPGNGPDHSFFVGTCGSLGSRREIIRCVDSFLADQIFRTASDRESWRASLKKVAKFLQRYLSVAPDAAPAVLFAHSASWSALAVAPQDQVDVVVEQIGRSRSWLGGAVTWPAADSLPENGSLQLLRSDLDWHFPDGIELPLQEIRSRVHRRVTRGHIMVPAGPSKILSQIGPCCDSSEFQWWIDQHRFPGCHDVARSLLWNPETGGLLVANRDEASRIAKQKNYGIVDATGVLDVALLRAWRLSMPKMGGDVYIHSLSFELHPETGRVVNISNWFDSFASPANTMLTGGARLRFSGSDLGRLYREKVLGCE